MGSFRRWPWASEETGRDLGLRLFIGLFFCLWGLAYAAFLGQIWLDTRMSIGTIAETYGQMGPGEFVTHAFQYLAWFAAVFTPALGVFILTSFSERLKVFFAAWVPLWIAADLVSTWLIRVHEGFAYALFVSGLVLAVSFLALFLFVQYDLWLKPRD